MRKLYCFAFLLLLTVTGWSQSVTISTTARGNNGLTVPNGVLTFSLENCGVSITNPIATITASSTGVVLGTVPSPASEGCASVASTYYFVSLKDASGILKWTRPYQFSSGTTTLSSPLSTLPAPIAVGTAAAAQGVAALLNTPSVAFVGQLTGKQIGGLSQVDQFTGTDISVQLNACIASLSAVYGGQCDARNLSGPQVFSTAVLVNTPNTTIYLPCSTITTNSQIVVPAGIRNVAIHGCALRGGSKASGTQGGTVLLYGGSGSAIQVGDTTYTVDTQGFHLDNVQINTTSSSVAATAIAFYRSQELDLQSLYIIGNANQIGVTVDGTGNYSGGTFYDVAVNGYQVAINAIGHQILNAATTDWMNASTFLRVHINCPTSGGSPVAGTIGINLAQGDGNTFTGGDVEGCSTALHLGANAQNNTFVGVRNENSGSQVVADAGSSYNSWVTGGTLLSGELTDNGTRNSFLDTFHRTFNGVNGDWYGSQIDATVTNHLRIGTGLGNERGLLDRYQTDYGYRWTIGLSDGTAGGQSYQILDELNNVDRLSIGQYLSSTANSVTNVIINNGGCYSTNVAPTLVVSGGGGSGAAGTVNMVNSNCSGGYTVGSVTMTNNGTAYTSTPTLSWSGGSPISAPNAVAEITTAGSTNNQTVINSAGSGAIVLNGSTNSGTGGVVFGSGGPSETTVALIDGQGNATFDGTLVVAGVTTHQGTVTLRNSQDVEIDSILWAGNTTDQKESYVFKDHLGNSQWFMVKDQYNNWALNSSIDNIDHFKAYQSGDTYVNAAGGGAVRVNSESNSGTGGFIVYKGGTNYNVQAFSVDSAGGVYVPSQKSTTGNRYVCINSSGQLLSQTTACSGT